MAGVGPPPQERKRRRNIDPAGPVRTITADGRLRGPTLKDRQLPPGERWHERTREWYDAFRRSAQAREMTPTDWQHLVDTALLHHRMWTDDRLTLAGEIRVRAAKLGATLEDRLRLRMRVEVPVAGDRKQQSSAASGTVTSIETRRARLVDDEE